jgi:uncharacterized membrane protein
MTHDSLDIAPLVELVREGLQALGIGVLLVGVVYAAIGYAAGVLRGADAVANYDSLRQNVGRAILLGLELLVAADIIRSVAVDPKLLSVGVLGLLVLVRTFLSWSLEVEVNGAWPWQRSRIVREPLPDVDHDRPALGGSTPEEAGR